MNVELITDVLLSTLAIVECVLCDIMLLHFYN